MCANELQWNCNPSNMKLWTKHLWYFMCCLSDSHFQVFFLRPLMWYCYLNTVFSNNNKPFWNNNVVFSYSVKNMHYIQLFGLPVYVLHPCPDPCECCFLHVFFIQHVLHFIFFFFFFALFVWQSPWVMGMFGFIWIVWVVSLVSPFLFLRFTYCRN